MSDVANRYALKTPIRTAVRQGEGEPITEVTLRRLLARDLLKTDSAKGEVGKAVILIACATGLDQATVANLDSADFEELSNKVGQMTGMSRDATPSAD